ncbi:hypothetical protein M569_10459 [Genlisea aurea]|uniref:Uncharacterized protein n=1 Tax=Genlisea aurea TaxID=192259 RepID=S8CI27_9LAMI|nr:hypothetical protein M569_10459 [Genlisea aurea]
MEKSIVAVGQSASGSKSLVPFVQIDSIAIDINCPMREIQPPQHDHFSIRGFVAGMRKKNSKTCSPFSSEGAADHDRNNGDGDDGKLPLLSVPKFRWWQCSHCVPETATATTTTTTEIVPVSRNDFAASTSRQNTGNKHEGGGGGGVFRSHHGGKSHRNSADSCPVPIKPWHENDAADEPYSVENGGGNGGFPYKRKPKLRSLADIMEEEKNSTNAAVTPAAAAAAETGKSPQRKKKMAAPPPEDGRACSEKRSRGHVAGAERTEMPDLETATRFNLQVGSRTKRVKPHRNRLRSRKPRSRTHDDSRRVVVQDSNEEKSSGREIERRTLDGSREPSAAAAGDSNSEMAAPQNGKIAEDDALNLSLNSYNDPIKCSFPERTSLPDLNESITAASENQLPSAVPEQREVGCCGDEENGDRRDNDGDKGGISEDIPMDIVELLARKQQERAIENIIRFPFAATIISPPPPPPPPRPPSPPPLERNGGFYNFPPHFPVGPPTSQFNFFSPLLSGQQQQSHHHHPGSNLTFNGVSLHPFSDQFKAESHRSNNGGSSSSIPYATADRYSNVDIPAMQLLSLTNQRGGPLQFGYGGFPPPPPSSSYIGLNRNSHRNGSQLLLGGGSPSLFPLNNHFARPPPPPPQNFSKSLLPAAGQMAPLQRRPVAGRHTPSEVQVCVLNRNPADFSIPEAGNVFTTSARDFKFRKRINNSNSNSHSSNNNGALRQRSSSGRKWGRKNSSSARDQQKSKNAVRKTIPKKAATPTNTSYTPTP